MMVVVLMIMTTMMIAIMISKKKQEGQKKKQKSKTKKQKKNKIAVNRGDGVIITVSRSISTSSIMFVRNVSVFLLFASTETTPAGNCYLPLSYFLTKCSSAN